jgi:hypothetical protein
VFFARFIDRGASISSGLQIAKPFVDGLAQYVRCYLSASVGASCTNLIGLGELQYPTAMFELGFCSL